VLATWLMRTVWPASVTAPLRAAPGFGAMSSCTDALPCPADGCATLIHSASLRAVHAHPSSVVTRTEIRSAALPTSRLAGDTS
jgi:hypothetical protein